MVPHRAALAAFAAAAVLATPCAGAAEAAIIVQRSPLAGFRHYGGGEVLRRLKPGDRLRTGGGAGEPDVSQAGRGGGGGGMGGGPPRRANPPGGRSLRGLGGTPPPVNKALAVDMGEPPAMLRRYVSAVRNWLNGEGPATHLPQRPTPQPVPISVAAVTSKTVEIAGELADGFMPFMWPASRVDKSKAWIQQGRTKAKGVRKMDVTVGIPTYIGDDIKQQREVARAHLAVFTAFPFFQRMFRASGFGPEADQMEKGGGGAALSDRVLDAVCLIGPLSRCREQLAAFRAAGTDLPIVMPPYDVDGVRAAIKALRQ